MTVRLLTEDSRFGSRPSTICRAIVIDSLTDDDSRLRVAEDRDLLRVAAHRLREVVVQRHLNELFFRHRVDLMKARSTYL